MNRCIFFLSNNFFNSIVFRQYSQKKASFNTLNVFRHFLS